ncbi:MAG: hypothetical protein QE271_05270 [Bacteriovoracaceae bacterium]|nr:hypothetical protein [Bacteriovoracaceae bacterium]
MKRIGFVSFLIILNLGLFGCPARNNSLSGSTNNSLVTQTSGGTSGGGNVQPSPTRIGQSVTENCTGDPNVDFTDDLATIDNDNDPFRFDIYMAGENNPSFSTKPPNPSKVPAWLVLNSEPLCGKWVPTAGGGQCGSPDMNNSWVADDIFKNDGPYYVRVKVKPGSRYGGTSTKSCPGRVPFSINDNGQPIYNSYNPEVSLYSFQVRSRILKRANSTSPFVDQGVYQVLTPTPYRIQTNACSPVIKVSPPVGFDNNSRLVFEVYNIRQNADCQMCYLNPNECTNDDFRLNCVDLKLVNNRNCIDFSVEIATNRTRIFRGTQR